MKKVFITGDGTYPLDIEEWEEYSVVYPLNSFGGASAYVTAFGVALAGGVLVENDQSFIEHGREADLAIVVTGYTAPFEFIVTNGGGK